MNDRIAKRLAGILACAALLGALGACKSGNEATDAVADQGTDHGADGSADADADGGADADAADAADSVDVVADDGATDVPPPDVNGRLEHLTGIDALYLWGTRQEMGYAEGSLLCGRITAMVRDYVLNFSVPNSGYDYASLLSIVHLMYSFPAGDETELEALLQGMQDNCPAADLVLESANLEPAAGGRRNITIEDLRTAHALADWACSSLTVWGAASATGHTLHARNLDFPEDSTGAILHDQLLKVYDSTDEGGARWLSVSFPGLIGCISCFGEDGGGITIHNSDGLDPTDAGGHVPRMIAARAALTAAETATGDKIAAAHDALTTMSQQIGNNFHLSFPCDGDTCTGGAVFEYDGDSTYADGMVTVRLPGEDGGLLDTDQAIACTNHYVKRTPGVTPSSGSVSRLEALSTGINDALTTGGLDLAGALALMKTTADINLTPTVHTVIMDTATMQLHLYIPPDSSIEAPYADPLVLDFSTLFSTLP